MRRSTKRRRQTPAKIPRATALGDAEPLPIMDVEWEARGTYGRVTTAFFNYANGFVSGDELVRMVVGAGWDPRWPAWMDLQKGSKGMNANDRRLLRELVLFAQKGEHARLLVRGFRAQRAAAREAWRRDDHSRARRLAGILTPDDRGRGSKYRPEHLAAYLELRRRKRSPGEAADEVCRRYHLLSRAGFAEWLRRTRLKIMRRFRVLEERVAKEVAKNPADYIRAELRVWKTGQFRDLVAYPGGARATEALLTPLPKLSRRERERRTQLRIAVVSPRPSKLPEQPAKAARDHADARRARRVASARGRGTISRVHH
jgi:hypothetical protein